MGRPRKEVDNVLETESTNEFEPQISTAIVEAKITPKIMDELPLKKGDLYLVKVNNNDVYWSRTQLNVAYQRNSHIIEIPKGSEFIPPVTTKNCVNCG